MPYDKPLDLNTKFNTPEWQQENLSKQSGRIHAITGTTSGTGYHTALAIAKLGGTVLLLNRSSDRSKQSLESLREAVPEATFEPITCDLQDLSSVKTAAEEILSKFETLDTLCLNAGVMALKDTATVDGYNAEIQTNVIAQVALLKELYPLLSKTAEQPDADVRIVFHSSIARYGGGLKMKMFEKRGGNLGGDGMALQNYLTMGPRWVRYQNTKLAASVLAHYLSTQMRILAKDDKIKVLVAHPGLANTGLQVQSAQSGGMPKGAATTTLMKMGQSAEDGAMGILRCLCDPNVKNGEFYGPGKGRMAVKGVANRFAFQRFETNERQAQSLWNKLQQEIGVFEL